VVSPYEKLGATKFWRTGVSETHPLTISNLYRKKFTISADDKIATAGSCFAQHIAAHLRANGYSILDKEPPPPTLDKQTLRSFGFGLYSARYGNIYTVRQLLQLAQDAFSGDVDPEEFWTKDGRIYDALRPNVEPSGFESLEEAIENRRFHLGKVRELLEEMKVFIFTLGLTEAWVNKKSGRVYPTAPGTVAGDFDPEIHAFKNFTAREIHLDFRRFLKLLRKHNQGVRVILTVSPVPLTATASDHHVLLATTHSKSVLRGVAGELADTHENIDYFPSYEIIVSPWSRGFFFEPGLRAVNMAGVAAVMRVFFEEHDASADDANSMSEPRGKWRKKWNRHKAQTAGVDSSRSAEEVCEDLLLDAFAP